MSGDILNLNLKKLYPKIQLFLGNLPYNISTQILIKVFKIISLATKV